MFSGFGRAACVLPVVLPLLMEEAVWTAGWEPPPIVLPVNPRHPAIACTPIELDRLRAAYRGTGPEHEVVAAVVSRKPGVSGGRSSFRPAVASTTSGISAISARRPSGPWTESTTSARDAT